MAEIEDSPNRFPTQSLYKLLLFRRHAFVQNNLLKMSRHESSFILLALCLSWCFGAGIYGKPHQVEKRGLLTGLGSFGVGVRVPGISSGLEPIAEGVKNIISRAKNTVQKLTPPISINFSAQIGRPRATDIPQISVNDGNPYLNNPNFQPTTDSYSHSKPPNENSEINNDRTNGHNSHLGTQQHSADNFPVFVLNENEIRR